MTSRSRSRTRDRSPRRYRSRSPNSQYRKPIRKHHDPVTEPSNVLGVFGLSSFTKEKELEDAFGTFGKITKVVIVYDARSQQSRGFGFITFDSVEDASKAKEAMNGSELDRKSIRVDYSKTRSGHEPTPGQYMGERRLSPRRRSPYRRRSPSPRRRSPVRRRSPSPRRRSPVRRSPVRRRSPSPRRRSPSPRRYRD